MRRAEIVRRAALDYRNALRLRGLVIRQPTVPARYAAGTGRPVVVLPGVYETWHAMMPIADALNVRGHPVHVVPGLGANAGPIPDASRLVGRLLEQLELDGVAFVAHSKGGLIGKLAMSGGSAARIDRLVALATPFAGSSMSRYMPGRALRAFLPTDPVIRSLVEEVAVNERITSIYPRVDPHIPGGSRLDGARNIELDLVGHFGLLRHPDGIRAAVEAVERESGTGSSVGPP